MPDLRYPVRIEEEVEPAPGRDEAVVSRLEMAAGHVIAKLKSEVKTNELLAALRDAGVVGIRPLGANGLVKLELAEAAPKAVPRALAALREFPQWLDYSEPDYVVHATVTDLDDPAYSSGEVWR